MIVIAMPWEDLNPDGALLPDGAPAHTYDWMVELLARDDPLEFHKDKIESRGWDVQAFENFRSWARREYGGAPLGQLYSAFLDAAPVWDRTDPSATKPLGWWTAREGLVSRKPSA